MTTNLWKRIEGLEGTTLATSAREHTFVITRVDADTARCLPQSTGTARPVRRQEVETVVGAGVAPAALTRARIQALLPATQNSSYIHAILVALDLAQ